MAGQKLSSEENNMADQEHVDILRQVVEAWNTWRRQHPDIRPDLSNADLSDADFSGADLSDTNLNGTYLSNANLNGTDLSSANLDGVHLNGAYLRDADLNSAYLRGANLNGADLSNANLSSANLGSTFLIGTNLSNANLSSANLVGVNLSDANLSHTSLSRVHLVGAILRDANLSHANLSHANLSDANLNGADLKRADLNNANLSHVNISRADLSHAKVNRTIFGEIDLREVKGLETVEHSGPSHLSINTIFRSEGRIPEVFLRDTGAPDTFIEYMRSLVSQPIQYYTCFISYSNKDTEFVDRLYADLQSRNVRCWLDKEDLKIGDKFRKRIDEAIRFHDKLLLVLSEHSVGSGWVEKEVETAFDKEHQHKKLVLFPVKLDETVMLTDEAWAADIRRMRHIGDFTRWKDHDFYQKTLTRLLRDLKAEGR